MLNKLGNLLEKLILLLFSTSSIAGCVVGGLTLWFLWRSSPLEEFIDYYWRIVATIYITEGVYKRYFSQLMNGDV